MIFCKYLTDDTVCFSFVCKDAPRVYFSKREESVRIIEGYPLTIGCNGNGYPDPDNFTWTKKTVLSENLISNLPTLYLNNVRRTDAGKYACEASNIIGMGRKEINVVVMRTFLSFRSLVLMCVKRQSTTSLQNYRVVNLTAFVFVSSILKPS